ncbi:hypothetical protein T01_6723 [Trichinella spiralis]|uniref:Secreted protein n=1 Tax=Trichinella spiralis TaxID=6334 RepID=A0A0V1BS21_TRISP|nr:hypothetical protein T01_6723 [Trichinella spiralis]
MGCLCNRLICVAPVIGTAALSVTEPREKRFLNTSHPKKVNGVYASPDGSTRRSDLSDRVPVPCLVCTVADLTTPSSLGWISMILPMGYLTHAVPGSCISTISLTLGSC